MNDIEKLLEKYWAGETNLEEDRIIKQHLAQPQEGATDVEKNLFAGLNAAANIRLNNPSFDTNLRATLQHKAKQSHKRLFHILTYSAAASIILAVGLFNMNQKREAYVVEKGIRYDDMEKAINCADQAMSEAIAPLKQSMQSLQPIKGLEGALTPSYKKNSLAKSDSEISNTVNVYDDSAFSKR
jgi:hypothetical protein